MELSYECFYGNDTLVADSVILVAHNAHVNPDDGNYRIHYQQDHGLASLLEHQVYGLMWDLYSYKGDVYLCHGSCDDSTIQFLQRGQGQIMGHQTLEQNLRKCNDFIQQNPQTVIFLFLESYVTAQEIETVLKKTGVLDKAYNDTLDQKVTFGFLRKNHFNFVIYSDYAKGDC